jgi:hypothetical protein
VHRQLATELPPDGERRGLVLSASKEVEPGARAMLLLADGLFRLDVVVSTDTIRTVVRNLSVGELEIDSEPGYASPTVIAGAEAADYRPSGTRIAFGLGGGPDRVHAEVRLAMLRFADRGTVRITAQAIVRQASAG